MTVNGDTSIDLTQDNNKILAELIEQNRSLHHIIKTILPQTNPSPDDVMIEKFGTLESGFYKKNFGANGKIIWQPDYHGLADYMVEVNKIISTDSYAYVYEDNFYQYIGRNSLSSKIDALTKGKLSPNHLNGFIQMIFAKSDQKAKTLLPTDGLINLQNGILDVKANKLLPHSHNYFFKYKLPHIYNPTATCPRFKQFLEYIFEKQPEYVDITAEVFGYCLLGGSQYLHKSFILYGEGRNGKSTWLDILHTLLGHENVSSVSLANLTKPFSVVNLDGKLANIVDETPNDQINAEAFKTATSGGFLTAAHKGKPEYSVRVDARFLFATNRLPNFNESSLGIKERLYFIRFDQYILPNKRDPSVKKMIINQEMSGVLNFAILGLQRLLKRGHLPTSTGNDETMDEFKMDSDSVYEFFSEKIEVDVAKDSFMSTSTLYTEYTTYCQESGRKPMSRLGFVRRFTSALKSELQAKGLETGDLRGKKRDDSRRQIRGFKNVYIRSDLTS